LRRTSNSSLLIRRSTSRRWRKTTTNCERIWGLCWRERYLSSTSPSSNLASRIGTPVSAILDLWLSNQWNDGNILSFSVSSSIIGAKRIAHPKKMKILSLWATLLCFYSDILETDVWKRYMQRLLKTNFGHFSLGNTYSWWLTMTFASKS